MANEHGSVPLVEEVLEAEVVGAEVVVVENESQVKLNRLIVLAEQSLLNDRKVEELSGRSGENARKGGRAGAGA